MEKTYINEIDLIFYKKVVYYAPIGILKVDLEGKIVEANETAQTYFEYSENELKNLSFQDLTPRAVDLEADLKLLQDCIDGSPGYSMTKVYITKTLQTFWAYLKVVPIRKDGELRYFLSFIVKHSELPLNIENAISSDNKAYIDVQKQISELVKLIQSSKEDSSKNTWWEKILSHILTKVGAIILAFIGFTYKAYHEWEVFQETVKKHQIEIKENQHKLDNIQNTLKEISNK